MLPPGPDTLGLAHADHLVAEQVLEALAALLEPDERQVQPDDRVADDVVRPVVVEWHEHDPTVQAWRPARVARGRSRSRSPPSSTSTARMPVRSVKSAQRRGAQQAAGVDGHEEVADPLDLAEQVARDDDRDPELRAGPPDQREHLVAAGRVEAVGRLVEEEQPRIVDERLGQLDPLLHPGRVAADRPVALLVQPDVAQHLGGPFARGAARAARTSRAMWVTKSVARDVRRQAVVLGHVADELADLDALARRRRKSMTARDPDVGGSRPSRILMSVLLPAPFAPTSPMIPGSRSSVSPSRATTPRG